MTDGSANTATLKDAALEYAAAGLAVFPLLPGQKRPATTHGFKDATCDADYIARFWTEHPTFNIGIAMGTASGGIFAIDVDIKDADGSYTVMQWEDGHGELPATATAYTGTDGYHLLYRTTAAIKSSTNAESGIDIRGDGGYIVAPPSVHPNGKSYRWRSGFNVADIAQADDNTLEFVASVQRNISASGHFELPDEVKSGDRNDTMFRLACSLQRRGLSDDAILAQCIGENQLRFSPPLSLDEVKKSVNSATKYSKGAGTEDDPEEKQSEGAAPWWHANKNGTFTFDHAAMGDYIIEHYHACLVGGAPAVWVGNHYELGIKQITRCCIRLDKRLKTAQRTEVVSYVQAVAPDKDPLLDFDKTPWVAFRNGCINPLDSMELVDALPNMYITNVIPWNFEYTDDTKEAEEFLDSLACGDISTFTSLQEVIGICMCSKRVANVSPMLIGKAIGDGGEASNGKSSFLDVLRHVIGENNTSSLDIATLGKRFQAQRIAGKLANIGDDIPSGFIKGEELSTFKKIVTGDRLYSDVKNGDGFEFTPSATMIFSMNSVPRLGDSTAGTLRRLFFIPFRAKFIEGQPGCDPAIVEKMTEMHIINQFLNIGLLGLANVARTGMLTPNPAMVDEVAEVQKDNSSVRRWIEDEDIQRDDLWHLAVADAYLLYKRWSESAGENFPVTKRYFCNQTKAIFTLEAKTIRAEKGFSQSKAAKCFVNLDEFGNVR